MKITFTGAARCVTGSCTLIETDRNKILVDCGMRQGKDAKNTPVKDGFAFNASEIDAVFLTHAHIDHSGFIPLLVKKGFTGKVFCTGATARLCTIMFPDAGHIQEMEAEWQNRKRRRAGKKQIEPIYTVEDAKKAISHLEPMRYGQKNKAFDDLSVRFIDAGHLLGSSSVELFTYDKGTEKKIVFSGDIGNKDKPIIKDPIYIESADIVCMESTYGDRLHKDLTDTRQQLKNELIKALARGGNIVIPSFAVGRTQEVLYDISVLLKEKSVPGLEKIPVYIDSPLGIAATEIFDSSSKDYYDKEAMAYLAEGVKFFSFKTLIVAQSVDESKAINFDERQKIIISSSGMCEAGRIKHHLKHNLWRADSTVIFVGYQAFGTLGRRILERDKGIRIFGEDIDIKANVVRIEGFSGHADKAGLIEWIKHFPTSVEKVFVMHGEEKVSQAFAEELKSLGYNAKAPELFEVYNTKELKTPLAETMFPAQGDVPAEAWETLVSQVKQVIGSSNKQQAEQIQSELHDIVDKWGRG